MSAWSNAVLALSPAGFYRLGESAGTSAADSSGNGRTGTYVGAPTLAQPSCIPSDAGNTAFKTATSGQYMSFPAAANFGTGWSIAYTFQGPSGVGAGLFTQIANNAAATADRIGIYMADDEVRIQYAGLTSTATLSGYAWAGLFDGKKHLVVATFAAGDQRLYVDGALVGRTSIAGTCNAGTAVGRLGQFSSSHWCGGTYDDFATFNAILTLSQVADLFAAWRASSIPSGAAVWNPVTMVGADQLHPNDLGMTFLAERYAAALADAGKTPAANARLWAYGDSYTSRDVESSSGQRAVQQLAAGLDLQTSNWAFSGDRWGDIAAKGVGSKPYVIGSADLVLIAGGTNNLQAADTAPHRAAIANHLRALLAVASAAQRIEQSAFTFGGTWTSTAFANAGASGGSNAYTTALADGQTANYNITTPGAYYLLLIGANGIDQVGGSVTISQAGTTLATVDLNEQHFNTGRDPVNSGYGPLPVRLELAVGTLTLTFDRAARAGTVHRYLDALVRVSATPPTILLPKPVGVPNAGWTNPTLLAYMQDLTDDLAAEFGSHVVVVDPSNAPGAAGLHIGGSVVDAVMVGASQADRVYAGADLVWSRL